MERGGMDHSLCSGDVSVSSSTRSPDDFTAACDEVFQFPLFARGTSPSGH